MRDKSSVHSKECERLFTQILKRRNGNWTHKTSVSIKLFSFLYVLGTREMGRHEQDQNLLTIFCICLVLLMIIDGWELGKTWWTRLLRK